MSFSSDVKEELSVIKEYNIKAELLAFLRLNCSIIFNNGLALEFQSTNVKVAKRFVYDLKKTYKNIDINLLQKASTVLTKQQLYLVLVENARSIIDELNLLSLDNYDEFYNDDEQSSYLRGAFLVSGSVNNPELSHHLEIRCKQNKDAIFLQKLMNQYNLNSKIGKRRSELIVYLKDSEGIQDFLNIIGATQNYFKYNEILINKKFKSDVKKRINCELFNASKSFNAGSKQLEDIKILEEHNVELDEKLKELINYRKEYIDASLTELVQIYQNDNKQVTKSTLNHRFRKLRELADEYRD